MALQWMLVCHGLVTLLVVVSFLCGQWPIFQGTFIEKIHHFITVGAYGYILRFIVAIFGLRGRNCFLAVEHYCCERPNPILQIIYLIIVGVTYFLVIQSSFAYIPGYYVSGFHRYSSLLAVLVGILLFLLTSFSDPGTVKAENVLNYLSSYPYDNIIYMEKNCSTCKISRPARSKHCSICNRCVARFDHHCGWMNNCIGEKNTRYFMAFLLWHFLLCLYGSLVLSLILAGQLKEHRVFYILTDYISWKMRVNKARSSSAAIKEAACKDGLVYGQTHSRDRRCIWPLSALRWNDEDASVRKENLYDKGMLYNLFEIIYPLSERASFSRRKAL
ncbi:unnamed protein product [Victoria cruziana]